ncbi:MAG: hypothetical protein MJZ16_06835, partial [Bacteroidales bacterium]|nr:hypothetical protein [Bacteroidales bacterium]
MVFVIKHPERKDIPFLRGEFLSTKISHNLTFWLYLIDLVGIETIVRTVTLNIASPKVRWCAPLSDGSIRVQHAEVAVVAGRLLNAVDVLMNVGIRLVEFVKHACTLLTVVCLYESVSSSFDKISLNLPQWIRIVHMEL